MALKIKIIHKGLTLIAVPLLFGSTFVFLFSHLLSESEQRFRHELLLKDAMIAVDGVTRRMFAARVCTVTFFESQDPFFKESYDAHMREAASLYKKVQRLLKSEPGLQVPVQTLKQEVLAQKRWNRVLMHPPSFRPDLSEMFQKGAVRSFFTNRPAFSLVERLRVLAGTETLAAVNSMNKLQIVLNASVLISVLLTIVMAVYFSLNITSRLLKIVDNTMRLSRGLPLSPPLEGYDEIAELDQFLFKSAAEIGELERFKRELIGVVSHELKSPLTAVAGFLSAFSAGIFGELDKKAQDRVERAHKSVTRLMSLVMDFLDLDRLEAGQLEMEAKLCGVDEIVKESVDAVRELSERSGVIIEKKVAGTQVFADRNRLVQVVVNLLSNAIKFSPAGGTVTVETLETDACLECRVSDQGRGIPESFAKEIFEPFKQIDTKDATTKKGTGLGLTISRSIVEQHGGKIGVDSVEGKGSTFWFKIPLSETDWADANRSASARVVSRQPEDASSEAASLVVFQKSKKNRAGKFGVLQKGLILVSVPLVFELAFVSVVGLLLDQIRQQVHREEHSSEIVDTLSRLEEKLALSGNTGMVYVATQDPDVLATFNKGKSEALSLFEHVKELSAGDAVQLENVKQTGEWMNQTIAVFEKLMSTRATDVQSLLKKSGFAEQARPLEERQVAQEKLLDGEKKIGEKLASQRVQMIKNMDLALSAGIILNILLSTGLAFYFVRSITSRLQHVMENTARLVRRETLEVPITGSDEIAYLDHMFYEAGKHLVELETFKRELIAIVSHELRTPLMSVSSSLQLLSAGALGELSSKARNRLKIAEGETSRLIRLINNLLDIEKMEAGKFVLDITEINASEIVDVSIATVSQLAESKEITLESSLVAGSIRADRDRLSQVMINLLSNAIKFSPAGGAVTITVEQKDSQMEFRVIDQGRGIPHDLQEKIFDRFVQVDKSDASQRGGSGLGLAIAKAIVEQHGGTIGVNSEPGRGSAFWFKLPVS